MLNNLQQIHFASHFIPTSFSFGFLFHFLLILSLNFMEFSAHVTRRDVARLAFNTFILLQSGQHPLLVLLHIHPCFIMLCHQMLSLGMVMKYCIVYPYQPQLHFIMCTPHQFINCMPRNSFSEFCDKIQQSNLAWI